MLNEVNSYRATKGAHPLVRNPGLDRMAHEHCAFLLNNRGKFKIQGINVSHDGFESLNLVARQLFGIPAFGENVTAIPSSSSPTLVNAWANSPGHDFTMESNDWQQTGIGILVDRDGMVFATQLFSTPTSSQMTFNNRMTSIEP